MSIASMIFGIIGLLLSCILVGILPCTISLILGIVALKNKKPKSNMAIIGIVTSAIGIIIFIIMMSLVIKGIERDNENGESRAETKTFEETTERYTESSSFEETLETKMIIEESTARMEESEETIPEPELESESATETSTTATEKSSELSVDEKLLEDLKTILSEDIANKAFDIMVNQIGFTEVKYLGTNSVGTTNYDFESKEYDFTLTASDDVYRIFQPNGGATFYADGEIKMTVADMQDRTIDHNDRVAYYMIAQMIVKDGLKSPRSAKFPSIVTRPEEIRMSKNKDMIAVQSYVDAENSFGASIRSQWTVEYTVIDLNAYLYEPIYVNIDGETLFGEFVKLD